MPEGIKSRQVQWTFEGNFVNDSNQPCADCSVNYWTNSAKLTNETTSAWWISGSYNPPATYTARLTETLTLSNGSTLVLSAKGLFRMYRPQATISAITTRVTVTNNTIWFGVPGFGDGITFDHTLAIPTNSSGSVFAGTNEWVQVNYNTLGVYQDIHSTNYVRVQNGPAPFGDYPIPYTNLFADVETGKFIPVDSPRSPLPATGFVRVEISDDFKMWMMFKPTGGNSVPLNVVSWQWQGVATNSGSGTWGLATSPTNHTMDPVGVPTEVYPLWKSRLDDFHWNPPQ